jgi:hypothetical protein
MRFWVGDPDRYPLPSGLVRLHGLYNTYKVACNPPLVGSIPRKGWLHRLLLLSSPANVPLYPSYIYLHHLSTKHIGRLLSNNPLSPWSRGHRRRQHAPRPHTSSTMLTPVKAFTSLSTRLSSEKILPNHTKRRLTAFDMTWQFRRSISLTPKRQSTL